MTDEELKYIETIISREASVENIDALKKIRAIIQTQITSLGLPNPDLKGKLDVLCTNLHTFLAGEPKIKRQHLCIFRAVKKRNFADGINHRNLYVFDLIKCSEMEIGDFPGIGEFTMKHVQTYLAHNGLTLGMPISLDEERELILLAKEKEERDMKNKMKVLS